MTSYFELPEGVHRGTNLRLVIRGPAAEGHRFLRLFVVVALDIVGHGSVQFMVRRGEHRTKGWIDCEMPGSQEIQVMLGPIRVVTTKHGTSFKMRDVRVRPIFTEATL